jgi:hypothetical protein
MALGCSPKKALSSDPFWLWCARAIRTRDLVLRRQVLPSARYTCITRCRASQACPSLTLRRGLRAYLSFGRPASELSPAISCGEPGLNEWLIQGFVLLALAFLKKARQHLASRGRSLKQRLLEVGE